MNYGAVLGLYYAGKFPLFLVSFKSGMAGLLFIALTLMVPAVAYMLTKRFRLTYPGDATLSFARIWSFTLQLFFYASIIAAAVHYIYFSFFDHGAVATTLNESLVQMQQTAIEGVTDTASWQGQVESMKQAVETLSSMTPVQITMQLFGNNLFWGCIAAFPVAILNSHRTS